MASLYFYKLNTDYSPADKENISETAKEIVKILASKILSVDKSKLEFAIGKNGKPYFKENKNFHFNISHSKNAIAVAVSNTEIGVDIEKLRNADFRVCDRFFTETEKEYVGYDNRRFFEIWTKKEAYIKLNGLALKNFKEAQSDNIFSTEIEDYIISVAQKEKTNIDIILLEKLEDL